MTSGNEHFYGAVLRAVLSCPVVSDSATTWTMARPASQVMGILQARILEWVAMPSSRARICFILENEVAVLTRDQHYHEKCFLVTFSKFKKV